MLYFNLKLSGYPNIRIYSNLNWIEEFKRESAFVIFSLFAVEIVLLKSDRRSKNVFIEIYFFEEARLDSSSSKARE